MADLVVRGVWTPQTEALFDIRVTDTEAQSYTNQSPKEELQSAENNNKKKYLGACKEQRGQFTLTSCSVDGMFSIEAQVFLSRVAERFNDKVGEDSWRSDGMDLNKDVIRHIKIV